MRRKFAVPHEQAQSSKCAAETLQPKHIERDVMATTMDRDNHVEINSLNARSGEITLQRLVDIRFTINKIIRQ